MALGSLLNKTATRQRFVQTGTDRRNHPTGDYSDTTTFPVALQTVSGREIYIDQKVTVVTYQAFADYGADVTVKDHLVIDGNTFNVLLVSDAAGMGHHLEIDLELISPDDI